MGLTVELYDRWWEQARDRRPVPGMLVRDVVVTPDAVDRALAQLDARQAVRDLHAEVWLDELRAGA